MKLDPIDKRHLTWDFDRFNLRDCPVCRSNQYSVKFVRPDGCSVACCEDCSVYFVNPAPSEEQLQEFYANYHQSYFDRSNQISAKQTRQNALTLRKHGDPRLNFLIKDFKQSRSSTYRVLDFGCGTGAFLLNAELVGAKVFGIEIDQHAVNVCQDLGLGGVIKGDIEDLKKINTKFDLIILNDLIEHVLDPSKLIEELCKSLKPRGKLLIWTPNGDAIENDPEKIALRTDLEHLQYLTSQSLRFITSQYSLSIFHYEQTGFPSDANFLGKSRSNLALETIKKRIPNKLKKLLPMYFLQKITALFVRKNNSVISCGSYHLFCVLMINELKHSRFSR